MATDIQPGAPPGWSRRPERQRRGGIVGPALLILLGALLLMQNLGILPPSAWQDVWRLWPLVLVLVGVDLLFGRQISGAGLLLVLAILVIGGVVALAALGRTQAGAPLAFETRTSTQLLQGAGEVRASVHFGAGELFLGALPAASGDELSTVTYDGPAPLQPRVDYTTRGGVGEADYRLTGRQGWWGGSALPWVSGSPVTPRMEIRLTPRVPLELRVETGAASSQLDLTQLRVTALDLSTGATTTLVRLPATAGTTTVRVSAGAATVTLEVPPGVAAQVRYKGGLSSFNVDQSRFPPAGDQLFRSPDYDTAANRVDLTIESGVSTVTVR